MEKSEIIIAIVAFTLILVIGLSGLIQFGWKFLYFSPFLVFGFIIFYVSGLLFYDNI